MVRHVCGMSWPQFAMIRFAVGREDTRGLDEGTKKWEQWVDEFWENATEASEKAGVEDTDRVRQRRLVTEDGQLRRRHQQEMAGGEAGLCAIAGPKAPVAIAGPKAPVTVLLGMSRGRTLCHRGILPTEIARTEEHARMDRGLRARSKCKSARMTARVVGVRRLCVSV